MLSGIDVSDYQASMSFASYDFVIVKSSEGVNYKDPKLELHANRALADGCKLGFYHYARPELGNSGVAEATSMLGYIQPYLGQCIIVLDWEQAALPYPASWCLAFMKHIADNTNARPIIYIQASVENTGNLNLVRDNGYGLWIAHWGVSTPSVKQWAQWALWQYTDTPYDLNRWQWDEAEWDVYAGTTATTYEWISSNNYLSESQMQNNAACVWQYFKPQGWSRNAVAALCGNMQYESNINPGLWESRIPWPGTYTGFGLTQWTPYQKITDWLRTNGYEYGSGIGQCDRILAESKGQYEQWYSTSSYPISFSAWTVSTADPGDLAYAFMYNYERPASLDQPGRKTAAAKWFTFLATVGGGNTWVFVPRLNENGIYGNYRWYAENPFYQAGYGMPNCTAYCWGRWYEIQGVAPNLPLGDANSWFPTAVSMGKKTGQTPQLGAILCTYYPVGGHVAVVEVINADGSIVVSNSGWGSTYFWTETLYPPNYIASWCPSSAYLHGFIYLDITPISPIDPTPDPVPIKRKSKLALYGNLWTKIQ